METQDLSDYQMRLMLTKKVSNLKEALNKATLALDAYGGPLVSEPKDTNMHIPMTRTKFPEDHGKLTTAKKAKAVLKLTGHPLTSSEILSEINRKWPKKVMKFDSFSSQWSRIYRTKGSPFKQYELLDETNEYKYQYGLNEWFEGNELIDEYRLKVREHIQKVKTEKGNEF